MPQYNATLQSMQSRVMMQRPGIDRNLVQSFLNERMRQVLDRKPDWSGLLKRTVLSIPNAYTAGQIAVTTGSTTVTGTNTAWPVSDVVNTIVTEQIKAPGSYWVTPASVAGITRDTILYVDSSGPYPEAVPVLDILNGHIFCPFAYVHDAGFSITASSLANRQLRVNSINPVFSVNAVTSPTSLILDNPWGQASTSGMGYQIFMMYTTFGANVKELVVVTDPVQQITLRLQVSQEELNQYDPNRTSTNSPQSIANLGPNLNGNMLYEIYPPQITAWQLACLYHAQWPEMRLPQDQPPPFLNSNMLIMGALADAFSTPCPRPPDMKDSFFSMENAQKYEARFEQAVIEAMNADESKYQRAFQWNFAQTFGAAGMGANWNQSHSADAVMGDY
jgi:hypothetical protein